MLLKEEEVIEEEIESIDIVENKTSDLNEESFETQHELIDPLQDNDEVGFEFFIPNLTLIYFIYRLNPHLGRILSNIFLILQT